MEDINFKPQRGPILPDISEELERRYDDLPEKSQEYVDDLVAAWKAQLKREVQYD